MSAGFDHTILIDLEGDVWIFGLYSFKNIGKMGLSTPVYIKNFKAYQVATGANNTMIIGTIV